MWRFALKRLLWAIPTLLLLFILTFGLTRLAPGDPVLFELAKNEEHHSQEVTLDLYQRTARSLGVDIPQFYFSVWPSTYPSNVHLLPSFDRDILTLVASRSRSKADAQEQWHRIRTLAQEAQRNQLTALRGRPRTYQTYVPTIRWWGSTNQFHKWIAKALRFDFGKSRNDGRPASVRVMEALRWTLLVNCGSIFLAYLIAIPIGVYRAQWPNSLFDRSLGLLLNLLYALPIFWMGTLLVVFFSTSEYGSWTNIFPAVGIWKGSINEGFGSVLRRNGAQLIIPILVLTSSAIAYISQQVRSSVSQELQKQYVWQLHAKGLGVTSILWGHVLRNASFPLITMIAAVLPAAIGGSLVMEVICNIPGMGRLLYDSIFSQDWNVVMLCVLLGAILTVVGIALADLMYTIVDPRTRPEHA